MRYRLIEMKPVLSTKQYEIEVSDLLHDREDKVTQPNPVGFYHAPVTMDVEQAAEELRACMIKAARDHIKGIEKDIEALAKAPLVR